MNSPLQLFDFNFPDAEIDYDPSKPILRNAYVCAKISHLCYKEPVNAEHMDLGYEEAVRSTLKNWGCSSDDVKETIFINSREIKDEDGNYVAGTQGLIIFYEGNAFIGFRGSEKKLNDWFNDLNLRPREFPHGEGKVHRGFLTAFEAVVPQSGQSVFRHSAC